MWQLELAVGVAKRPTDTFQELFGDEWNRQDVVRAHVEC